MSPPPLASNGCPIVSTRGFGLTALMIAAGSGHINVVQTLLDKGANIKAKDNNKWTALVWANSEDHKDVVKLLNQVRDRTL